MTDRPHSKRLKVVSEKVTTPIRRRFTTLTSMWKEFYAQDWEDKWIPTAALAILVLCFIYGIFSIIVRPSSTIPAEGGMLSEGVVGAPRTINPIIASSDADRDLVALIYAGVLKKTGNGTYIEELADSVVESKDGRTFTITLKEGAIFHDGTPVTADDVAFTYETVKKSAIKSQLAPAWKGVSIAVTGQRTIVISLPRSRPSFKDQLTLGIMPRRVWANIALEDFSKARVNISPVGAGPFKITEISYDSDGNPEKYKLERFEGYSRKPALLDAITLSFYESTDQLRDAYKDGDINAWARIPPQDVEHILKDDRRIVRLPLARAFALFVNVRKSGSLSSSENRQLLSDAIDRDQLLVRSVNGFGNPLKTISSISWKSPWQEQPQRDRIALSESTRLSSLSFVLTTPDIPELVSVARTLKEMWTNEGATVMVDRVSQSHIAESVIQPRSFEVLLYGITLSQYGDLVAYLHSSERQSPGLNISGYSNGVVDNLSYRIAQLSNTATNTPSEIEDLSAVLSKDNPIIMLYQPELTYLVPSNLKGLERTLISAPRDRYSDVTSWYLRTSRQ